MKYSHLVKSLICLLGLASSVVLPAQAALSALVATTDVRCFGADDGSARLTLLSGNSPVQLNWQHLDSGDTGSGTLDAAAPVLEYTGLKPGDYRFSLTDALGQDTVLNGFVFEPPLLTGAVNPLVLPNGYNIACAGISDGKAQALVSGGTPPYAYLWLSGEKTAIADSLASGANTLQVMDALGCAISVDFVLDAPAPIAVELDVYGERCLGENSGAISVVGVSGGNPPYEFSLDGALRGAQKTWVDLPPGIYFLEVFDQLGCAVTDAAILPSGLEFAFEAGPDLDLFTGDTLLLVFESNQVIADIMIDPPGYGRWIGGDSVLVYPFLNGPLSFLAVDENGCEASDDFFVQLRRRRSVYAPNVFYPEAALADNRSFTLFDGGGVRQLQRLQVFDRWGRQVFDGRELPMGDSAAGWDGRVSGRVADSGVYYWIAQLLFTDGRVEEYSGDVTLLR